MLARRSANNFFYLQNIFRHVGQISKAPHSPLWNLVELEGRGSHQALMALRAAQQAAPAYCAEEFASEKAAEPMLQHSWFWFPGHTGTIWFGEPGKRATGEQVVLAIFPRDDELVI